MLKNQPVLSLAILVWIGIFTGVADAVSKGFHTGPEIHVDIPVYGPAPSSQYHSAVAFDGENFLVIWEDNFFPDGRILGLRINPLNEILDTVPMLIQDTCGGSCNADIAFDGTDYLVVWEAHDGIEAAWIDIDGEVRDRFVVSPIPFWYVHPAVTCGQTECMVAWGDDRNGAEGLYVARVALGGHSLDPDGIMIQTGSEPSDLPDIAYDGTNYFVAWLDYRKETIHEIFGARITPGGQVLDPGGFFIAQSRYFSIWPAVTYDETNFVVSWIDEREDLTGISVFASRITSGGDVLDPGGFEVTPPDIEPHFDGSIAFDGANNLVTWTTVGKLFGSRLSPDGTILDPTGFLITEAESSLLPGSAPGKNGSLVVWSGKLVEDYVVETKRVDVAGQVLDPEPSILPSAANDQRKVVVGFDGVNFLLVWEDYRTPSTEGMDDYQSDLYGIRIDQQGNLVGVAFPICTNEGDQVFPQVAFNGAHYLVTWIDNGEVYCTPVTPDGQVTEPTGIPVGEYFSILSTYPAVASDGTGFMVALSLLTLAPVQVDQGGNVSLGEEIVLYDPDPPYPPPYPYTVYERKIAYDGSNYILVHQRDRIEPYVRELVAMRISSDGTNLDPEGIILGEPSFTIMDIAGSDNGSLLVWRDGGLYGMRISQDGELLDREPLVIDPTEANNHFFPEVSSDGVDWVVAWVREFSGFIPNQIMAARIFADGTVEPEGGITIASFETDTQDADLFLLPGGKALSVYSRILPDHAVRAERAMARLIDTAGDRGLRCTQPTHCADGFCVDGVCCDSACGDGDPNDCQACSAAAGATQDGSCETIPAGWKCRDAADDCDAVETCDGQNPSCPADDVEPAGVFCRAGFFVCDASEACDGIGSACPPDRVAPTTWMCRPNTGPCDAIEYCNGITADCPIDRLESRGAVCRAQADDCDKPEECTGFSDQCPDDELFPDGHVCREIAGPCDVEDLCDGVSAACPADDFMPDGTDCDDSLYCNGDDACGQGACLHSGDPCRSGESCHENGDMCVPLDIDDDDDNDDETSKDDDSDSDDDSGSGPGRTHEDDDDDENACGR